MIKLWLKIYNSLLVKEKRFIRFIIIITLILTLLPLAVGLISQTSNQFYTNLGFLAGADRMVYFSQIEEARQGHILLSNLYTSEPQRPSIISPLWLILGGFSKITSLPVVFTFHLARLALGYVFLWLLYLFLTNIFLEIKWRKIAFLILCFGSGFGVFTIGRNWGAEYLYEHLGTDLWVSEGNTFLTLVHSPLFILSQLIILIIFWWAVARLETAKYKEVLLIGLLGAFLGILHPYDLFILFPVIGIWFLVKCFKSKQWLKNQFIKLIIICLVTGIVPIYFCWLKIANPAFSGWLLQNETLSPKILNYFIGYGLIFILYLIAIFKTIKSNNQYLFFLSLWSIVGWFLLFFPFQFQRRMANGFHLTLTIIAVIGLKQLTSYLIKKKIFNFAFLRLFVVQIVAVLLICSTIFFLGTETVVILWDRYPIYIPKSHYQAIVWLKKNVSANEVILANSTTGNVIPAFSGRKVFIGHGHQTNNWLIKKFEVDEWFFKDNQQDKLKQQWLKQQNIDYLLFGFYEKRIGKFNPFEKSYLQLIWQNRETTIFKVKK